MFGFGISVAMEREQGLLKLKRALPMPTAASLVAKMLMSILLVAIAMATMEAAAPLGHLRLGAGQLLNVSLVSMAGALPFRALGFLVGSLASGKAAPAYHLDQLGLASMGMPSNAAPAVHVLVLAGLTLV